MTGTQRVRYVTPAALLCLVLTACATARLPDPETFRQVENAIDDARAARAQEQAPIDLRQAEDRLAAARAAHDAGDARASEQALAEALVAAELARAKSRAAAARAAVDARRRENALLRRELLGNGEMP